MTTSTPTTQEAIEARDAARSLDSAGLYQEALKEYIRAAEIFIAVLKSRIYLSIIYY